MHVNFSGSTIFRLIWSCKTESDSVNETDANGYLLEVVNVQNRFIGLRSEYEAALWISCFQHRYRVRSCICLLKRSQGRSCLNVMNCYYTSSSCRGCRCGSTKDGLLQKHWGESNNKNLCKRQMKITWTVIPRTFGSTRLPFLVFFGFPAFQIMSTGLYEELGISSDATPEQGRVSTFLWSWLAPSSGSMWSLLQSERRTNKRLS